MHVEICLSTFLLIEYYRYQDPKPDISIFREASFGHGELDVVNATHAQWSWHRNDDDEAVVADTIWITNPSCTF